VSSRDSASQPAGAAIRPLTDAIYHATGKRIRHLPIHVEDLI
jgi:CO/xanthine dehydrogenase Mo-binding subunit